MERLVHAHLPPAFQCTIIHSRAISSEHYYQPPSPPSLCNRPNVNAAAVTLVPEDNLGFRQNMSILLLPTCVTHLKCTLTYATLLTTLQTIRHQPLDKDVKADMQPHTSSSTTCSCMESTQWHDVQKASTLTSKDLLAC